MSVSTGDESTYIVSRYEIVIEEGRSYLQDANNIFVTNDSLTAFYHAEQYAEKIIRDKAGLYLHIEEWVGSKCHKVWRYNKEAEMKFNLLQHNF
jgi:hypothetical protein